VEVIGHGESRGSERCIHSTVLARNITRRGFRAIS